MKMPEEFPVALLAPCGINCGVCYVLLRKKKPCLGCRGHEDAQPNTCRVCKIKVCALGQGLDYCSQCQKFPCAILKRLDKSYRQRYQASIIANAQRILEAGTKTFLEEERATWQCKDCGGVFSLHDRVCSECGKAIQASPVTQNE